MLDEMINLIIFQFDKLATILNLLFIKWLSLCIVLKFIFRAERIFIVTHVDKSPWNNLITELYVFNVSIVQNYTA